MSFTIIELTKVSNSSPKLVTFIAPDNSYLRTRYEHINNPHNPNVPSYPRHLTTRWNVADRHEAFEEHPSSANTRRFRGPMGWIFVNPSDGLLYADGSSAQATAFHIDYIS